MALKRDKERIRERIPFTATSSHYNKIGQMEWSEDDQNRRTDYAYDYRGKPWITTYPQVNQKVDPLIVGDSTRKMTENSYLPCCGLLEWTMDENLKKTYYEYDGLGRTTKMWTDLKENGTSVQSSNAPLVEYTYDDTDFGVMASVKTRSNDSTQRTISYAYDGRGMMIKMSYPNDIVGAEEFLYDDAGRLVMKKDGEEAITAYRYSYSLDRLASVDYEFTGSFAIPANWPTSFAGFSPDVTYIYDGNSSRVTQVYDNNATDDLLLGAAYTYDSKGRIKDYIPAFPEGYGTISYNYNTLGQKTSMVVPLGVNNKAKEICYSYDNTGRLTGTYVKPAAAIASNVSTPPSVTGDTMRFYYNESQNRVKLIDKDNEIFYYVYDPTASIPAVLVEINATDPGRDKQYLNIREPDGALVSRETYDHLGDRLVHRTYHFDGLGSTVALSDESGNITDTYSYDAWGNVTHTSGSTGDNPYQYVGRYGYYTHYQQADFGLLQLGVRYYDPGTGRFTQKDPAKDGLNWYAYVEAKPLNAIDPYGLSLCVCPYKGNIGKLTIDCSCRGKLDIWVIPEDGTKPAFTPVQCGKTYDADGFKIGSDIYKIDGSTCITIKCSGTTASIHSCINCIADILGKRSPYVVKPGTFGNEPPSGKPAKPVK